MEAVGELNEAGVLILDYGSQYTLLIARRLREWGVYSTIVPFNAPLPKNHQNVLGIVLSGGPDSVTTGRQAPDWIWEMNCPILGICYGMQLIAQRFGGKVHAASQREYGASTVVLIEQAANYPQWLQGLPFECDVWQSHGDEVVALGPDLESLATTKTGITAIIAHKHLPILGCQFHPEVFHSPGGRQLLMNFAQRLCGIKEQWLPGRYLEAAAQHIRETVGDGKVLMAVSGGVDSTVMSVLLDHVLGAKHYVPVLVDHGFMRENEVAWIQERFRALGIKHLQVLSKAELFAERLADVVDPEKKRQIIGHTFIEVFEQFAKQYPDFTHLGQGTLYPDVIESAAHGVGSQVIKTHHNVGGLPEHLPLALVEPFRFLFKDEVRELGKLLKIPTELLQRQPFPGPGLAIRIIGAVTADRLELLRQADRIFLEILEKRQLTHDIWQAFVVLLPVQSVGVMGDNRTYEFACALRAVNAVDGMTADVSPIPMDVLLEAAQRIVSKVKGINRVVYDITSKPPGTIEWE